MAALAEVIPRVRRTAATILQVPIAAPLVEAVPVAEATEAPGRRGKLKETKKP